MFALEGRVVIYDVVVSVSQGRVFLIGPHEKLHVVKEMPASHDHTVAFAKFFRRGYNASGVGGSFCRLRGGYTRVRLGALVTAIVHLCLRH